KLWSDASRAETSATSNALRRNELAVITGLADAIGSGLARESLCGHADACSAGLRQCLPQDNGDPPPKSSFATLAPAFPQPPTVFIGWMLGMANGPMRAYTSFGTP